MSKDNISINNACPFPPNMDPSKIQSINALAPKVGVDFKIILICIFLFAITYFGVSIFTLAELPEILPETPNIPPKREITVLQYQQLLNVTPEKAEKLIIDKLGSEYFHQYFTLHRVNVQNTSDSNWFAQVTYLYHICVEDKTYICDANVWFDEYARVIRSDGIPSTSNLMPFNISESKAFEIAKNAVGNITYDTYSIRIQYNRKPDHESINGKYLWKVWFSKVTSVSYKPSYRSTGTDTGVYIDVYNGQVYDVETGSWITLS